MTHVAFEVGHRTTHGFPLLLALGAAALLGFMIQISRPVAPATHEAPPAPQEIIEPAAPMM